MYELKKSWKSNTFPLTYYSAGANISITSITCYTNKGGNVMDKDVSEHYSHNGRYLGTLKVGTKGQILISKEVRDFFGIHIGELLVLLADKDKGIALQKMDGCNEAFQMAFQKEDKE